MSNDANSADYAPLTPLNTANGRNSYTSKSRKGTKPLKESKPVMEICEVRLDEVMDLELAGRLTATAIEQFLFFMNQVPFPVSRLAKLPATNEKTQRLRNDFMTSHKKLLLDIKSSLGAPLQVATESSWPPFRLVVTLGTIMLPKAAMLFQIPTLVHNPILLTESLSDISYEPTASDTEPPPDSDSDPDDGEPSASIPGNTASISSPLARSPFKPFQDVDPSNSTKEIPPLSTTPLRSKALFRHPATFSNPHQIEKASDENQTSKSRLDKRFKVAERDLTVAISNLNLFNEEIELSKIHVYLQVPRTTVLDGWHPRPSAAKTLDLLANFPHIDVSSSSKLAKMNAFAVKVTMINGENTEAFPGANEAWDHVWLEWGGKLMGVE